MTFKNPYRDAFMQSLKHPIAPITVLIAPRQFGKTTYIREYLQWLAQQDPRQHAIITHTQEQAQHYQELLPKNVYCNSWRSGSLIGRRFDGTVIVEGLNSNDASLARLQKWFDFTLRPACVEGAHIIVVDSRIAKNDWFRLLKPKYPATEFPTHFSDSDLKKVYEMMGNDKLFQALYHNEVSE